MRIVFAADVPDNRTGGMSKQIHSVADALRELNHTVDTLWADGFAPQTGFQQLRRFEFPIMVARHLAAHASLYDVVCIHEPSAAAYAVMRKRRRSLPPLVAYVFALERREWLRRHAALRITNPSVPMLARVRSRLVPLTTVYQADFALRNADHVICTSSRDADYLTRTHRVPPACITRIDIGVSPQFLAVPRGLDSEQARLLFAGTWIDRKGCMILSGAFARAHARVPSLRLTILGAGTTRGRVLQDFAPHVRHAVEVVPSFTEPEMLGILAHHDIYILPSFNEGMPLTLLEAMAAGLAVVSTTAGAIPDVVEDGIDGLLTHPGDVGELSEAIVRCATNASLRHSLSMHARTKMHTYTWQRSAMQHLNAFQSVRECAVGRGRPTSGPRNVTI